MSEKEVVRRIVALALGVICILLIAGLGGAIAYYAVTINNKDSTLLFTIQSIDPALIRSTKRSQESIILFKPFAER